MKFSIRFADQIVGTLVILALAILVFVIFMLGKSQRWFAHDPQYVTYFNSASGISNNMAIQYKGFTIGHVKKISLTDEDKVEVILSIFEEHSERVRKGSLVEVSISPIGLGNTFIFYPGKGTPLGEGEVIPEVNSADAKKLDSGMVDRPESNDGINSIIGQVPSILNEVDTLLKTINIALSGSEGASELTLGQTMYNLESTLAGLSTLSQTLREQLSPVLDNLKALTDELSDPSGTVMTVLGSEGSLATDLSAAIKSLAGIIENLDKTSEFLPAQLPQIGVMLGNVNGMLRTAQDVLTSVANNPLLKSGIPEHRETGPGAASPRDINF
jgi:phospholipid/cholesterol/gamma-HCH transport system substrate-binding protein